MCNKCVYLLAFIPVFWTNDVKCFKGLYCKAYGAKLCQFYIAVIFTAS